MVELLSLALAVPRARALGALPQAHDLLRRRGRVEADAGWDYPR